MKRVMLFLLGFSLFSACTKEKEIVSNVSVQQKTTELKQAHEKLLTSIQQLGYLSMEQLQQVANSSTPLQELKELSPKGYQEVEKYYNELIQKLDEAKDSGISETEVKSLLKENATLVFQNTRTGNQNFTGVPCYDTWELTVLGSLATYSICVGGAGWTGVGLGLCSIGLGVAMLIAEERYDRCLDTTYE